MKSFTDMDEAYEFAKSVQEGFTKEELIEVMSKLAPVGSDDDELSDEDLANVAGGEMGTGICVGITTASAVSIGVSAGAAAAV